jgi:hypothetical protein
MLMSTFVAINGIEYAESNYPNYCWFWTWPLDRMNDRPAHRHGTTPGTYLPPTAADWDRVAPGDGCVTFRECGDWHAFERCPCGVGYSLQWKREDPSLCAECGRGKDTLVKWVGRRTANRWEWKPEAELPADLRVTTESDFDARVRAAVEVEVAERMAAMEKKK